jgi:hypothetical protein
MTCPKLKILAIIAAEAICLGEVAIIATLEFNLVLIVACFITNASELK